MILNKLDAKMDAINSLSPDLAFHLSPDGVVSLANIDGQENKGVIPSEAEIQVEITRLQTEYDSKEYSRKRKEEYPSIEECVHAILDDELEALQIKRQIVKDKYPKE